MKKAEWVDTPRYGKVQIADVYESLADARAQGYTEPTHYKDENYAVLGKSTRKDRMVFAAAKKFAVCKGYNALSRLSDGTLLTLMREQGYKGEPLYDEIDKYRAALMQRAKAACETRDYRSWVELYDDVKDSITL